MRIFFFLTLLFYQIHLGLQSSCFNNNFPNIIGGTGDSEFTTLDIDNYSNTIVGGWSSDGNIVNSNNQPNPFAFLITKNGAFRWGKYFSDDLDTVQFVKFTSDGQRVVLGLGSASPVIVCLNTLDGSLLYSYQDTLIGGQYFPESAYIDQSENLYLAMQGPSSEWEVTKFALLTSPISSQWSTIIQGSNTQARAIIKGVDENEFYIGGFLQDSSLNTIASLSRITSTGLVSWHYGFDQGASPPNYLYTRQIQYLSYGANNFICGCQEFSEVSGTAPFEFFRFTLNSDPTNVPTLAESWSFSFPGEVLRCAGFYAQDPDTFYSIIISSQIEIFRIDLSGAQIYSTVLPTIAGSPLSLRQGIFKSISNVYYVGQTGLVQNEDLSAIQSYLGNPAAYLMSTQSSLSCATFVFPQEIAISGLTVDSMIFSQMTVIPSSRTVSYINPSQIISDIKSYVEAPQSCSVTLSTVTLTAPSIPILYHDISSLVQTTYTHALFTLSSPCSDDFIQYQVTSPPTLPIYISYSPITRTFTVDYSSAVVGITTIILEGVLPNQESDSVTFDIKVTDCQSSLVTASLLSDDTYTISSIAKTLAFAAFTTSITPCSIQYFLSNSDDSPYEPSLISFSPVTRQITIQSNSNTLVGIYNLKVTGQIGASLTALDSINFVLTVSHECTLSVISPTSIPATQTYTITQPIQDIANLDWTIDKSVLCGPLVYSILNQADDSIADAIFSIGATNAKVQTNDNSKVGIYNLKLRATSSNPSWKLADVNFQIQIVDQCTLTVVSPSLLATQTYNIDAPEITINILSFTESVGSCGPITYAITNPDSSFITVNIVTQEIKVQTSNLAKVGLYSITVTGTAQLGNQALLTFDLDVKNPCLLSVLSTTQGTPISNPVTYQINTNPVDINVDYFTSSVSDSLCGAMQYQVTKSDDSAIDGSIFNFQNLPSPLKLTVHSTDTNKVGLYNLKVRGYQGTYTTHYIDLLINIDVVDDCTTAIYTTTAIATQEYQIISSALLTSISDFTSSMSNLICGSFQYQAAFSPSASIFTFTPTPSSLSLSTYSASVTDIGTYTITISGWQGSYSGNKQDLTYTIHVVQKCPIATITTTPILATQVYQVNTGAQNILISDFTSTLADSICGPFTYHADNFIDSSAIDSSVFTFIDTAGSMKLVIQTADPTKEATYQIRINGHQGTHSSNTQSIVITIQVKDDCKTVIFTKPSIAAQSYQINAPVLSITIPYFTSSMSNTICGVFTYSAVNSNLSPIDSSVLTFTQSGSLILNIQTSAQAKVGTYNILIKGKQGTYTSNEQSISIAITIYDNCPTATLGTSPVSATTYTVYNTLININITPFTSSVADSICGAFQYSSTLTSLAALDGTVFTFTSTGPQLSVSTSDKTKVGTYNILVKGYQQIYPSHSTTVTFTVTIVDACPTAVISSTAIPAVQTYKLYYTASYVNISPFTSSLANCGAIFTYSGKNSDGTAMDSTVFTVESNPRLKIQTSTLAKVGTYYIRVTGYQGTYNTVSSNIVITVNIVDMCPTATITTFPRTAQTYYTKQATKTISITAFTSTEPNTGCGVFLYQITNSDTTAIDSTVFTLAQNPRLSVYTTNLAKVGVYNFILKGYQTNYPANFRTIAFTVTIVNPCPTATLANTALSTITQNVYYPSQTVTIAAFTSTQTSTVCGAFSYSATKADGTAFDSTIFTFPSTTTPSLVIQTNDKLKTGTYQIKVKGYQGTYSANFITLTITINVVDKCLTATITTTPVSAVTQNIYYPQQTVTITDFTSSEINAYCGAFTYTATKSDDTPFDSLIFSFPSSTAPQLLIQTNNPLAGGSYQIKVKANQGLYTSNSAFIIIAITIVDPCTIATISTTAVLPVTQSVYYPQTTIPITAFTSSISNIMCGNFIYSATKPDGTAFDSAIFTFPSTSSPSLIVQTNNPLAPGSYQIKVSGHQGIYSSNINSITISFTIIDLCLTATITTVTVSNQAYTIRNAALITPFTAYTSSELSSYCGNFVYSAIYQNGTPLDALVFTFDSVARTLTTLTSTAAKAGTYQIKITGYQGIYTSNSRVLNFDVVITDPCTIATFTLPSVSPSPVAQSIYKPSITVTINQFVSSENNIYCGNFVNSLTYQDNTPIDGSVFTFDVSNSLVNLGFQVQTSNPLKAGTYNLKLNGYQSSYPANTQYKLFTVVITDPCLNSVIITPTYTSSLTYVVDNSIITQPFSFTYDISYCGPFIYTVTNPDSSFITVDTTNYLISVYSQDLAKVNSYTLIIRATLTNGGKYSEISINLNIQNPCLLYPVLSLQSAITNFLYNIETGSQFFTLPQINVVPSLAICGSLIIECKYDTMYALDVTVYNFLNTNPPKIYIQTQDQSKIGTYGLALIAYLQNGPSNKITNYFSMEISQILGPCRITSLKSSHPINDYQYILGAKELNINMPTIFESSGSCGNVTYFVMNPEPNLIIYSEKKNQFSIKTSDAKNLKSYSVQIIGTIQGGASLTVPINIEVVKPPEEQKIYVRPKDDVIVKKEETPYNKDDNPWNQQQSALANKTQTILTAEINSISLSGEMVIKFSTDLIENSESDKQKIDKSVLNIKVIPGQASDMSKLGFDWKFLSIDSRYLKIQLNFENPSQVSSNQELDQIQVMFLQTKYFKEITYYSDIPNQYRIQFKLPQFLKKDVMTSKVMNVGYLLAQGIQGSSGGFLVIGAIISTALSFLWTLLYSLQLIIAIPKLNLVQPANLQKFYQFFENFSISPNTQLKERILLLAQTTIYGDALMSNGQVEFSSKGDKISAFLIIIQMILIISLPVASLFINFKKVIKVDKQTSFIERFDSLRIYLNNNKSALCYTSLFLIRRLAYALTITQLQDSSYLQIQLVAIQSILMLSYLVRVQPFTNWRLNCIEIFNEICFLVSIYLSFGFTDYGTNSETKYSLGYYTIFLTSMMLISNCINLIITMIVQLFEKIRYLIQNRKNTKKAQIYDKYHIPNQTEVSSIDISHVNTELNYEIEKVKNYSKLPEHEHANITNQVQMQQLLALQQKAVQKELDLELNAQKPNSHQQVLENGDYVDELQLHRQMNLIGQIQDRRHNPEHRDDFVQDILDFERINLDTQSSNKLKFTQTFKDTRKAYDQFSFLNYGD